MPERLPDPSAPRMLLQTCGDIFAKLRWEAEELARECDAYRAFNFAVTAHHLWTDWIDRAGTNDQKTRRRRVPNSAAKLSVIWRDIANASKHFVLDEKASRKQHVANVRGPYIGDWQAFFLNRPAIYVSDGAQVTDVPSLCNVTVQCLDWVLNGDAMEFPDHLNELAHVIWSPDAWLTDNTEGA